jgi:hypothetical protein
VTDAEIIGWVADEYKGRHGPRFTVDDADDLDTLLVTAADLLGERDAWHLIEDCDVGQVPGDPTEIRVFVTVRGATGRYIDLTITQPKSCFTSDGGTRAAVDRALTSVLEVARGLLADFGPQEAGNPGAERDDAILTCYDPDPHDEDENEDGHEEADE